MATVSRLRTIGRVTGVAATTAPYVRRLATDDELRDDVGDFISSFNNLMSHLRSDRRLRRDLQRVLTSAQSGAGHLRADVRPRSYLRMAVIGAGLLISSIGIGIALAWPRSRQSVMRVADQTAQRANATVHDIRERIGGQTKDEKAA
jgi:hypothetical protein